MLLGIWTDRYGGRLVYTATMLAAAAATFLLSYAQTYPQMLVAALGVGMAGGSFAVGVAYVSRFYPGRAAGHGARHLRRRQCRRRGHEVPRAVRHGRLGLADRRAGLGGGARRDGGVFWLTTDDDPVTVARRGGAGAAPEPRLRVAPLQEPAGLALRPLLLLRLRRLRGAGPVAAALPDRRLRLRHQDRGHDRRGLLDPRLGLPRLWRRALRQGRRPHGDVLDVRRLGGLHFLLS